MTDGTNTEVRKLKWLECGPIRLDVDTPLLAVGVTRANYPETFPGGILISTGGGLNDGNYLAADANVLEEQEIGVIFQQKVDWKVSQLYQELNGMMDVWVTGEVVRGEFLVSDVFLGDRQLIRDELKDTLKRLDLESIDDQFLGYH